MLLRHSLVPPQRAILPALCTNPPLCSRLMHPLQAQQALSVALNKVGELHHMQGDLETAAKQYAQALQLRRGLLAATRRQWAEAAPGGQAAGSRKCPGSQQAGSGDADAAVDSITEAPAAAEGDEACCSAVMDLAASCLKLAGAKRGLGSGEAAEASDAVGGMLRCGAMAASHFCTCQVPPGRGGPWLLPPPLAAQDCATAHIFLPGALATQGRRFVQARE